MTPLGSISNAFRQGFLAAWPNRFVMLGLLVTMASMVVTYYNWPNAAVYLTAYADWQKAGGLFRTALIAGLSGGLLSELSVIYLRDGGRWTPTHLENMVFRFLVFFVGGAVVAKFYEYQAFWWGNAPTWRVILPKVLVDQFVFSVFWATVYQAVIFRWQALRYSPRALWSELSWNFVLERMLPVLVTNWLFWIPGVTLIYTMPQPLQMPLNIFAAAIWAILLAGLAEDASDSEDEPDDDALPEPVSS